MPLGLSRTQFVERLVQKGIIPAGTRIRVSLQSDHQITCVVREEWLRLSPQLVVRVDLNAKDVSFIRCFFGASEPGGGVRPYANPFLLEVVNDERFAETKPRLMALLKMDCEEFAKFTVLIARGKPTLFVRIDDAEILAEKDWYVWSLCLAHGTVEAPPSPQQQQQKPTLGRKLEASIKIYN
jgi:hypothetical protein